ncbi:hypothetical protein L596_027699 [Steinernema carpocapsae]|uniref:Uncharacterized protein n=1 Tax=Steinernema carpocapsae TaxID=34508 RepID=A0A4U5LW93_STECR|nr:hypothetical protein L596_027699 [Steinernema carpocapsae]
MTLEVSRLPIFFAPLAINKKELVYPDHLRTSFIIVCSLCFGFLAAYYAWKLRRRNPSLVEANWRRCIVARRSFHKILQL